MEEETNPMQVGGEYNIAELPQVAEPLIRKRARRLTQLELLGAQGNISKDDRFDVKNPRRQAAADTTAVEVSPRERPEPGAMADRGNYAQHERLHSKGLLNWRRYGKLPPAQTIIDADGYEVKIFEWRGLFKNVDGRKRVFFPGKDYLGEQGGTDAIAIREEVVDFWDFVRLRWLVKEYGSASTLMGIPPGMSSFIKYFVPSVCPLTLPRLYPSCPCGAERARPQRFRKLASEGARVGSDAHLSHP
jgi:hypothetical protein